MSSKKKMGPICAAYNCNKPACFIKKIDGKEYLFCLDHKDCLNHSRASVIMEIISSCRFNQAQLEKRYNYEVAGFTVQDLRNTRDRLLIEDEIDIKDDILILKAPKLTCKFFGCKTKSQPRSPYCTKHKDMPNLKKVEDILEIIRDSPRSSIEICEMVNLKPKCIRMVLSQLMKFGYIERSKRGVVNYYVCL